MTAIPLRANPWAARPMTTTDDGFDEVFRDLVPAVRRLTWRMLGDGGLGRGRHRADDG